MPRYFYCHHCGKRTGKNPRLKTNQRYCGCKTCQQYRKNLWELEKLKKDPEYYKQRKSQKARWRKERPGHQYQVEYRQSHHLYAENNRFQQRNRNQNVQKLSTEIKNSKIVKTDALTSGSLVWCGLYEIQPYKTGPGKKIVKTDALIVEIRAQKGFQKVLEPNSG